MHRIVRFRSGVRLKIILAVAISFAITFFIFFENVGQNTSSNQNPYVKEYALQEGSRPDALLVDDRGIVWISTNSKVLLSLDPKSQLIKNFTIEDESGKKDSTNSMVWAMMQDASGKIWFSGLGTKSIWQFEPLSRVFHMFHSELGSAFQMKIDKNENIWFTTLQGDVIGVIEKQRGEYKISTFKVGNNTTPAGIFLQNDSAWIANVESQNIFKYKINTQNNFVQNLSLIQRIPKNNTTLSSPTDLLIKGNSIWLTEHGTSFLTRYDLNTDKITRYPTSQNSFHTTTLPFWIRAPENSKFLWFNEHEGNKIGNFDLENKMLVEYAIPTKPKDGNLTYPLNISEDPRDGKILWFSEWNTDKVGMIDGHIQIPFQIKLDTQQIALTPHHLDASIVVEVQDSSDNSHNIFLNASSSITSTAELGNLTATFSPKVISHDQKVNLSLHNGGVAPGNYTIGVSASDGYVTKTEFLDLSISK